MQVKCVRRNLAVTAKNVNEASMPFREEPKTISEQVISEMHKSEWGRVF
jgi:L-serine deaminase